MAPIPRSHEKPTESSEYDSPTTSFGGDRNMPGNGKASSSHSEHLARKTRSWYGPWPREPKSASTHLARETILGRTLRPSAAADLSRFERKESGSVSVHSAQDGKDDSEGETAGSWRQTEDPAVGVKEDVEISSSAGEAPPDVNPDLNPRHMETRGENAAQTTVSGEMPLSPPPPPQSLQPASTRRSSGWFGGWLPWSPGDPRPAATQPPPEPTGPLSAVDEILPEERIPIPLCPETTTPQPAPMSTESKTPVQSSPAPYWFNFWSATATPPAKPPNSSGQEIITERQSHSASARPPAQQERALERAQEHAQEHAPERVSRPSAGSTWAFWSKDFSPREKGKTLVAEPDGEIAVIGEESEANPTPASRTEVDPASAKPDAKRMVPSIGRTKRGGPPSAKVEASSTSATTTSESDKPDTATAETRPSTPSKALVAPSPTTAMQSQHPPNLVLPNFAQTYRLKEDPSIIRQVAAFLFRTQQATAPNQVFRAKSPPRIRRAIAIGVHGLFPATYLRPMIGQPTGTSFRFAGLATDGIRRWAENHGFGDVQIEKIALEGEGKIAERVDNLWRLLLNWIEQLRHADLIIIACHSQGVPVGIMLLAKLLGLGIITSAKIGVCAMAGVSLGPFTDYKSNFLLGSAAELWEFANPTSDLSQRYEAALEKVLAHGARITLVGSIDDQVVPMESAIHSPLNHPYVYRAVFIDGRIHASDFIAHLVGFALKLRNIGISDHGLIRELSVPLAGSLYSGEGHSRLYYDDQVYDLAIAHALETTDIQRDNMSCIIHRLDIAANSNPYHLPWVMRGLLEEDFVRTELSAETDELLKQFDAWKPSTKALKDVKYRLEAVRSRL